MPALRELFATDVGIMSVIVIIGVLAIGAYIGRFVARNVAHDAAEAARTAGRR